MASAPMAMHGRISHVRHVGDGLFEGMPQDFSVVRSRSLAVTGPIGPDGRVTAWTDDGVVMGIEHRSRPMWGVHPEQTNGLRSGSGARHPSAASDQTRCPISLHGFSCRFRPPPPPPIQKIRKVMMMENTFKKFFVKDKNLKLQIPVRLLSP